MVATIFPLPKASRKKQRAPQARRKASPSLSLDWLKPTLALITVIGSLVGLAWLLEWMNDPHQWPVRSVLVEGRFHHLERARLQDRVAPLASEGFFAVNVAAIQEQLQRLPWVDQASVRRVWPDRLLIEVREQQPVAYWGQRGFVNDRAQLFEPEEKVVLAGMPQLDGPAGHQRRVLAMYKRLQDSLRALQLDVSALRLDARRSWHLKLSNGLSIEVGRKNPEHRVSRFVRVYPAILAAGSGRVVSVDLRYSNGLAVHWRRVDETSGSAG